MAESGEQLAALASALGVTIDYLVRGSSVSPPMLEHRALFYGTRAVDEEIARQAEVTHRV